MNYLQIINKCLVELNYKQVSAFSELVKNDHKKLKNIINVLNADICGHDNWEFLLKKAEIKLPKAESEIKNIIEGKIKAVIVDKVKFNYCEDYEKFFLNKQPSNTFSIFNNKILFPTFNEDKNVEIIYYTKNYAIDENSNEISEMTNGTDSSLIPMPFAEPLLVYGACMRLKGNPQHVRFNYWFGMYKDALANLRSKISVNADYAPSVKLHRR